MFYVFPLQTNASVYETKTQQYLEFDVYYMFNDVQIDSSIDPVKVLQNTLKKQHEEMLSLALTIPQTGPTQRFNC